MSSSLQYRPSWAHRAFFAKFGGLCALATLGLAGCAGVSPMAKPAASFSTATTAVVEKSEDAYAAANRLNLDEQVSAAALNYDRDVSWDPASIKPLLTREQIAVRTHLLDGLKTYAQTVSEIANYQGSKELDTGSAAVGNNLVTLSSNLAGVTGADGVKISQEQVNYLSTAVRTLGSFLIDRKVRRELPVQIGAMDPAVRAICEVLGRDVDVLETQSDSDYKALLKQQDQFLRHNTNMSAVERRGEIRRLPLILRKSEASHDLLENLKTAIAKLAVAHHALAEAARGGSVETLRARIAELDGAARNLAAFYQTLPSS